MQACWAAEQVGRAIQNTANLSSSDNHYFLASHAPIRRIVDERSKVELSEAEYFNLVFRSAHRNVQAIVYGEPGTGKSHLIHWLKLRCDEEVRGSKDLSDIRCVLIERRNGSLKDALLQIVEQLGDQFATYLEKIQSALRQISSETARKELAGQFWLELGTRRADRDRSPLPPDLRHLSECFVAPGFGEWLCRDGGIMHRLTSRLTESSTIEQRQNSQEFAISDFLPANAFQLQNPPNVRELIDQFYDDEELCRQACSIANEVIREAVLGMTGLTSVDLQNVFFDIRRELAREKRRLVILVEDVSVYQVLDRELVVAFEPQVREGLCDLRVVFGMTTPGLDAIREMPDNQIQRITFIHSVSSAKTRWGDDPKDLAKFMGRYLNAIRLSDNDVRALAMARREGNDVSKSACDDCPFSIRDSCHAKFGAVEFDEGVTVGLFPFTRSTASQWLSLFLDRNHFNVRRTPRSLLTQLMFPALEQPQQVPKAFPPASVPIPAAGLSYWIAFEEQFCGNWPTDEKRRLQRLATAWIKASSASEAAQQLIPLRDALGFPEFTSRADQDPQKRVPEDPHEKPSGDPTETPPLPEISQLLQRILISIEEWKSGAPLLEDTIPRDLLLKLLKNSISWQDVRAVSPVEIRRLLQTKDIIDIEGQRAKARWGNIRFRRSQETADLLQALARFEYQGNASWSFEDSERFKRIVASWVRRNTKWVVDSFVPDVPDASQPLRTACEYLAFIAATSSKKQLPMDRPAELISVLFADPKSDSRRVSSTGQQLVDLLRAKQRLIREWVANELSIPQGLTGGCVFIDPRPILEVFRGRKESLDVSRLAEEYARDFFTARYAALVSLPNVDEFWAKEREALQNLRGVVVSFLGDPSQEANALSAYCQELGAIKKLQKDKEVDFPMPHDKFDPLWNQRVYTQRVEAWTVELGRSREIVSSESQIALAAYTPEILEEMRFALQASEDYLDNLETLLRRRIEELTEEGDPDTLATQLKGALEEVIAAEAGEDEENE